MKKILIFCLLIVCLISAFSKTKKSDEKRFQIGFGGMVSTSNLMGMIENTKLYQAIENGSQYDYPGLDTEQSKAINNLAKNMGRAILVANILGGLEYGFEARLLWNALMLESDLIFLPFDASYNGRMDFVVTTNIGIRAPFWIMPYITAGANFTFSWYPENVTKIDKWKSWGVFNNFVWRPGVNLRCGLDLKFRHFSIGAYYQYTIKDFDEFVGWWQTLSDNLYNKGLKNAAEQAAGLIFASQSRFGISMVFYFM
ncbi:MAG: hypothetical protein A2Y34_09275 [Spirochaetes bacterium GWC1_27_15]|nr:MAG: hypothetical protein A2Z98_09100 [Spirochaetes bacterium GWB1_27_13]OHD26910.1 MAG: hypothetical protein A2Y34_09275 [Spirochaetes bacterium GWC1_27_15]